MKNLLDTLARVYKILTTDLEELAKPESWPDGKVPLFIEYCSHIESTAAPTDLPSHLSDSAERNNPTCSSWHHY